MKQLHHICGRKVKPPVIYRNNVYGTFRIKIRTTKLPVLMPKSFNKNINVKMDDVIHGNYISTYDVVVMENLNQLTVVISHILERK